MSVRVCFEFRVHPGMREEYLRRHDPVAADMLDELHRAGIRNYSIFLGDDGRLVGSYETDDPEATDRYLSTSSVARDWDEAMSLFFLADERSGTIVRPLREVFHLDTQRASGEHRPARP